MSVEESRQTERKVQGSNPPEVSVDVYMDWIYTANKGGAQLKTWQKKETFKTLLEETGLSSAWGSDRWVSKFLLEPFGSKQQNRNILKTI